MAALHADSAALVGAALSSPVLDEESHADAPVPPLCSTRTIPLQHRPIAATTPAEPGVVVGAVADLVCGRPTLIAENAFLRQRLIILRRSVKRPHCTPTDRTLLVLLASRLRAWHQALLIVQPEAVLRWHRQGCRLFRLRKSRPRSAPQPKVASETIALIREMAAANWLWGAERIRGELRKLGIRVATTTVQRHLSDARPSRRGGQLWATFLRDHAGEIWACDFLPVTGGLFRPLYAFVVVALGSRRVIHVGVTRYLIRDNDRKYGPLFARVAAAMGIAELRTAYRAPRQNATCERFLGSVRRECLDHVPVLGERHLRRVLREYADFFDRARPHQALHQRSPDAPAGGPSQRERFGAVHAIPILGGLHHDYQRAA